MWQCLWPLCSWDLEHNWQRRTLFSSQKIIFLSLWVMHLCSSELKYFLILFFLTIDISFFPGIAVLKFSLDGCLHRRQWIGIWVSAEKRRRQALQKGWPHLVRTRSVKMPRQMKQVSISWEACKLSDSIFLRGEKRIIIIGPERSKRLDKNWLNLWFKFWLWQYRLFSFFLWPRTDKQIAWCDAAIDPTSAFLLETSAPNWYVF